MKYVKKPVVVEAIQFTENNIKEVLAFMGKITSVDFTPCCTMEEEKFYEYCENCKQEGIPITTLEGDIRLKTGDYLIRGTKGELYPCKPDIFKDVYEPVEE